MFGLLWQTRCGLVSSPKQGWWHTRRGRASCLAPPPKPCVAPGPRLRPWRTCCLLARPARAVPALLLLPAGNGRHEPGRAGPGAGAPVAAGAEAAGGDAGALLHRGGRGGVAGRPGRALLPGPILPPRGGVVDGQRAGDVGGVLQVRHPRNLWRRHVRPCALLTLASGLRGTPFCSPSELMPDGRRWWNGRRVLNGFFAWLAALFVDQSYAQTLKSNWARTNAWQSWWSQERQSTFNALIDRDTGQHHRPSTKRGASYCTVGCAAAGLFFCCDCEL